MADRVEREIEEILARLEDEPEKTPISIADRREQRKKAPKPARSRPTLPLGDVNPSLFLLAGAAAVIAGLVFSSFASGLIWIAFAGVVVFLGAFVASFLRSGRPAKPSQPAGHFWRDRYIDYEPSAPSPWARVKRRFRGR
ncbi:MAG: hypothetical protein ACKVVT_09660 [Dehalococcoidia bacterium]